MRGVGTQGQYPVVIAGGGVIGSAIAYFLASDPDFDGEVLVLEPDPSYQECSTARSLGSFRQQFSTPENIQLSSFGFRFVCDAAATLAVDGEEPDVGLVESGYLFLASAASYEILKDNYQIQRRLHRDTTLLSQQQLAERYEWMHTADLAGASFGVRNEGWCDPYALLMALRRKAESLGVRYRAERVCGIERNGARVDAVQLGDGERIACAALVNASGTRAAQVAAFAGFSLPVESRKRSVFFIHCRERLEGLPLMIDSSGVYLRPEGQGYLCGVSPPAEEDPERFDLEVDHHLFEERVWPALAHRIPCFEAIRLQRSWAGHYAYNTLDQNAILGPHPECPNFLFANGFSGHGLQHSAGVGRGIAELIVHGAYRSLDLSCFGYERLLRGEALLERNII